ncbi:MAG: DUF3795 domain-containing protein [Nitrospirae bacterium]|nr:MAG: DUF3795 domain-containing protein [Nitrospirota bacterium]
MKGKRDELVETYYDFQPDVPAGNPLNSPLAMNMKRASPIAETLIAPCGMNCAICSRYLAYVYNLKRSQCVGCRPRNEKCAYLFGKCRGID